MSTINCITIRTPSVFTHALARTQQILGVDDVVAVDLSSLTRRARTFGTRDIARAVLPAEFVSARMIFIDAGPSKPGADEIGAGVIGRIVGIVGEFGISQSLLPAIMAGRSMIAGRIA